MTVILEMIYKHIQFVGFYSSVDDSRCADVPVFMKKKETPF